MNVLAQKPNKSPVSIVEYQHFMKIIYRASTSKIFMKIHYLNCLAWVDLTKILLDDEKNNFWTLKLYFYSKHISMKGDIF